MSIELAPKSREGHGIYLLIFLLLLHLTLLSLQVQDPSGVILLKRWVLVASAPFINLSSMVSQGMKETWTHYVWLRGARDENARLQQAVQQLSLQVSSMEQLVQENQHLRALLAFKDASSYQSIGARVVGRAPSFLSRVVYLDRGSADGVSTDCPVVTGDGIVGRVVLATSHNSQLQLITNADASVGILVERTGSPGVVRGTGGNLLEVSYVSSTEEVAVGDLVITSGLDHVYPKGLPVGRVVKSSKGNSVFRDIQIEPAVDLLRINEALILLSLGNPRDSNGIPRPEELNNVRH